MLGCPSLCAKASTTAEDSSIIQLAQERIVTTDGDAASGNINAEQEIKLAERADVAATPKI